MTYGTERAEGDLNTLTDVQVKVCVAGKNAQTTRKRSMGPGEYEVYYAETGMISSHAFAVHSLGYSSLSAKTDYQEFLLRNPVRHRFSVRGRILKTVVLCLISGGHGCFESRPSGRLAVPSNSIFFAFPGIRHFYKYDDETGWDEFWLEMSPDAILPILEEAGVTPEKPLRTFTSTASVHDAFNALIEKSRIAQPGSDVLVEAAAHRVLGEVVALWRTPPVTAGATNGIIESIRQMLVSNIRNAPSIAAAAKAAGLSQSRLRELFRRTTGLSPKRFQMRARLLAAGRLLRDSDMTISAVAEETGFDSIYAFSHVFRSEIGMSPTEYRKRSS